jgi:hypothetical protein
MTFAAVVVGVPVTLLCTAVCLRVAAVRPALRITACTLLTSLVAVYLVHKLQPGGNVGPAWESIAALAIGFAAGVVIGGRSSNWRWRVVVGLPFLVLLLTAN